MVGRRSIVWVDTKVMMAGVITGRVYVSSAAWHMMIAMAERGKSAWVKQESAGGVVVREVDGGREYLAIKPAGHERWQLPKGRIDFGETAEQAAVREVREEGGVTARIEASLPPIRYFFQHRRQKIAKVVYYFLMRYESGDPGNHDNAHAAAL